MSQILKSLALVSLAAGIGLLSSAQRTMNLQGTTYTVDTVSHYKAGPAMKYSRLKVGSPSNTFAACVLEIDMKASDAPKIKVEVGRDSVKTAEAVTSMAKRKSNSERRYVAGINGDFFITSSFSKDHPLGDKILGFPNVTSATEGKLISPDAIDVSSREKCFILAKDGGMWIDATDLTGTFSFPGKKSDMKIYHTNYPRTDSEIMLYNSYYGGWTKTDNTGWEVTLELAPGETWALNRPVKMVVSKAPVQGGNSAIPKNGAVISAGKSRTSQIEYIKKYQVGDEVNINLNVSLPKHGNLKPENISEIIGGDVRILNQGNVTKAGDPDAIRFINTATAKYIRTLIGYSEDRSKLVFCTVDAGLGGGGVTYYDAGDLMRELGCYDALDFDGGGSTLMYLRTPGIVNHLRDGSERAVGNAIYAVVEAPEDNTVSEIRFSVPALKAPQYSSFTPVFYGYNRNGELISMDVKNVTISVPDALGKLLPDGKVMFDGSGCHALEATYNGFTTTIPVTIEAATDIRAKYSCALINHVREWAVDVITTVNGDEAPIAAQALSWVSTNPEIASITSDGVVKGLRNGSTILRGTLNSAQVEVNLDVQIPSEETLLVADLAKSDNWTLKGTSIASGYAASQVENGLKVDYRLSSTRSPSLTLTPNPVPFYAIHKSFSIDIASPLASKVIFHFNDASGESFSKTFDNVASGTSTLTVTVDDLVGAGNDAIGKTYPMQVNRILFYPQSGKTATDYNVTITNPTLHYDEYAGVEDVTVDAVDSNAPIIYYDITGRQVANPTAGNFYIRRQGNSVKKIIL